MSEAPRERIRYFVPGPVYVLEATRQAMLGPVVGHRSAEFKPIYARITERLKLMPNGTKTIPNKR